MGSSVQLPKNRAAADSVCVLPEVSPKTDVSPSRKNETKAQTD
jgi:hypothetical protein